MTENEYIERLAKRLLRTLPGTEAQMILFPESRKFITKPPEKYIKAAVLILIHYPVEKVPEILFIKRTEYDGHHSGQVSFPGGKADISDSSLEMTALRECEEEVGISRNLITILGQLTTLYIPVSNFNVYPFVGYCRQKINPVIDPNEVAYSFTCPLSELTNLNVEWTILNISDSDIKVPYFSIKNEMVWGATAMILSEFIEVLKTI